jgi:hypothetical protein
MGSVIEIRAPDEADRKTVRELFYAMPIMERGAPIFKELLWVLLGRENEGQHVKALPDYCYPIFDALKATYFKNFPALTDIIFIKDKAGLPAAETVEAAKKVIQMDWRNLGRISAIGVRCIRFAELEAENGVDGEGFDHYTPDKRKQLFTVIFGRQWVEENAARIATEKPDKILAEMLNQFIAPWTGQLKEKQTEFDLLAYQWSPSALIEFNEGFAQGLTSFLDENTLLTGETNRSETYSFLLLAWPEIKVMLEANPQKTVRHLHEWMQPFMRVGVTTYLDIDKLRDICAPPSGGGIGLALRPLKSRLLPSSA